MLFNKTLKTAWAKDLQLRQNLTQSFTITHIFWLQLHILYGLFAALGSFSLGTIASGALKTSCNHRRHAISLQLSWHFNHIGLYVQIFMSLTFQNANNMLCAQERRWMNYHLELVPWGRNCSKLIKWKKRRQAVVFVWIWMFMLFLFTCEAVRMFIFALFYPCSVHQRSDRLRVSGPQPVRLPSTGKPTHHPGHQAVRRSLLSRHLPQLQTGRVLRPEAARLTQPHRWGWRICMGVIYTPRKSHGE